MSPFISKPPCDDVIAWLRLTLVPGISPQRQQELLRAFGTPQEVLAQPAEALFPILGAELADALTSGPEPKLLDRTLAWLDEPGHHLLTLGDASYPSSLLHIAVPPTALYARGRLELLGGPTLAIVGSRNATPAGLRDAEDFARALSEAGFCVASGLALGIDAAAHRGGLSAKGSSVAVVGTGPDRDYPPRNRGLAARLAAEGCIVSEFPIGTPPAEGNFPRRNRLISGLGRGVLVVEAARRSGSLITARYALEQGRDVFAIPGSIHSALSKGCHAIIKDGAKLVEDAQDILSEYGIGTPLASADRSESEPSHPLLEAMGFAPLSVDQIAQRAGLEAAAAAAELARLQVEGRICAIGGGWFQRAVNGVDREPPAGAARRRVIE